MHTELLESLQNEFQHELFLYPWEIFELRIQEEMVRCDRTTTCFGYMEIPFTALRESVQASVVDEVLWRFVFRYMAETLRGSDIKGFLSENHGLGIVFLDSDLTGVQECRDRLWGKFGSAQWLIPAQLAQGSAILKVTRYPVVGTI